MTKSKKRKKSASAPHARFLFFQNGFDSDQGHWLPEILSWRRAVLAAGMNWHCFAHTGLDPRVAAMAEAQPVIPFLPGQIRRGLAPVQRLESFFEAAEKLPGLLRKHYPGEPRADDLLYVGYATDVEMIGVARWLEGLKPAARPRVAFFCHHPAHEWRTDVRGMSVSGDFHRWVYAARRLMSASPRVRFFGAIPALSKELTKVVQAPFLTIPFTCQIPEDFDPGTMQLTHDVGILGGARTEQGITLCPAVLRSLKSLRPEIRVMLQCQEGPQEEAFRRILRRDGTEGMVSLICRAEAPADHLLRLASCRLILLPYLPEAYCLRGSGVFFEANCVGRPVVAAAATSMGRMILSGISSGHVFRSQEPNAIAVSVCEALDRLHSLATRSGELRAAWSRRLSTDLLLRQLLESFGDA